MAEEQKAQFRTLENIIDTLSSKLHGIHLISEATLAEVENLSEQVEALEKRVETLERQQEVRKKPAKKSTPPPTRRKAPQRVNRPKVVETHHFTFGGFRLGDRIVLKDQKDKETPYGTIHSFTPAGWARITLEDGGYTPRRTNNIRKRK